MTRIDSTPQDSAKTSTDTLIIEVDQDTKEEEKRWSWKKDDDKRFKKEKALGVDDGLNETEVAVDRVLRDSEMIETRVNRIVSLIDELEVLAGFVGGTLSDPAMQVTPLTETVDANFAVVRGGLRGLGGGVWKGEAVERVVRLKRAQLARRVVEVGERYRRVQEVLRGKLGGVWDRYVGVANASTTSDTHITSDTSNIFANEMLGTHIHTHSFARANRLPPATTTTQELVRVTSKKAMLEKRGNEIKKIEASIKELVGMFADMRDMIEAQDQTFATIETSVTEAQEEMEKGMKELDKAIVLQRSGRKRRVWLWGLITAIVIVACILLYVFVIDKFVQNRKEAGGGVSSSSGGGGGVSSAVGPSGVLTTDGGASNVPSLGVVLPPSPMITPSPAVVLPSPPLPSPDALVPSPSPALSPSPVDPPPPPADVLPSSPQPLPALDLPSPPPVLAIF
ncbi:hypothetical protein HDU67_000255 [Dinochytrium kinnereticum]|nr:hypothetical protein HDU67_000255 [Dinochytrium kinnereticum]